MLIQDKEIRRGAGRQVETDEDAFSRDGPSLRAGLSCPFQQKYVGHAGFGAVSLFEVTQWQLGAPVAEQ